MLFYLLVVAIGVIAFVYGMREFIMHRYIKKLIVECQETHLLKFSLLIWSFFIFEIMLINSISLPPWFVQIGSAIIIGLTVWIIWNRLLFLDRIKFIVIPYIAFFFLIVGLNYYSLYYNVDVKLLAAVMVVYLNYALVLLRKYVQAILIEVRSYEE